MKIQKIVSFAALGAAVLCVLYGLSVMTGVYNLVYPLCSAGTRISEYEKVRAYGQLFYDFQPFNKTLITFAVICLLCSLTLFITHMQKRRRYHIGNYISVGLCSVANLAATVWTMISIAPIRAKYQEVILWLGDKLDEMEAAVAQVPAGTVVTWEEIGRDLYFYYQLDLAYSDSMFWFDAAYVVFGLLMLATLLLVGNLIWKTILMKREDALLAPLRDVEAV